MGETREKAKKWLKILLAVVATLQHDDGSSTFPLTQWFPKYGSRRVKK